MTRNQVRYELQVRTNPNTSFFGLMRSSSNEDFPIVRFCRSKAQRLPDQDITNRIPIKASQ